MALLLTWVHDPEEFAVIPQTEEFLAGMGWEGLYQRLGAEQEWRAYTSLACGPSIPATGRSRTS